VLLLEDGSLAADDEAIIAGKLRVFDFGERFSKG